MEERKRALLSTRHHFSMRSLSTQSDTMTTMNPESNVSLDVASFPAVNVKLLTDLLGFKILNTIVATSLNRGLGLVVIFWMSVRIFDIKYVKRFPRTIN